LTTRPRTYAPVWSWGLASSSFGFYGGTIAIAVPQLLAAQHLPESRIAALTGLLLFPGCTSFLLAPILDVRFSRKSYAFVLAAIGAICLFAGLMLQTNLTLFIGFILAGYIAINLYQAALGGWQASIVPAEKIPLLSVWVNIANIGAGGVMAYVVMLLLRSVALPVASGILATLIFLPTLLFFFMPQPLNERRLMGESFRSLIGAIFGLLRRREVLLLLLLFLLPSSSFALTNILGGLGADFHTPELMVSLLSGLGVSVAGVLACVLGGPLCARLPLRRLYLGIGIVGGVFTLSLLLLPRNPTAFGIAMLGENAMQALAFTVAVAIVLKTVGHGNALAATESAILVSAQNLPIVYMQFIDGEAYQRGHLAGAFTADAGISIAVCSGLLVLLAALRNVPGWRSAASTHDNVAELEAPSA
jgi:PAT family beta-lactamase induction signal transducer AmpG